MFSVIARRTNRPKGDSFDEAIFILEVEIALLRTSQSPLTRNDIWTDLISDSLTKLFHPIPNRIQFF